MNKTLRRSATIAGVLLILATALGVASAAIRMPIEESPDFLVQYAANDGKIILSAFLIMLMAFSCAGVGLALFPIIKQYGEGLALATAGFRIIESGTQLVIGSSGIAILALSQSQVSASVEAMASSLKTTSGWLADGPMLLAWCTGALIYYTVFYHHKMVPRWLSGWGLVGITLTISYSIATMLGFRSGNSAISILVNAPIALQEMVFAVWLIVNGVKLPEKSIQNSLSAMTA